MPTVIGIDVADGAVIASDRQEIRGGRVVSEDCTRTVEIRGIGIGASGGAASVQSLQTQLEDRLRTYEHQHDRDPSPDALEGILTDLCPETGTACIVACRDGNGEVILLTVDAEGGSTREPVVAIGTGAELAIGTLDRLDREMNASDAAEELKAILRGVAERDTATGEAVDLVAITEGGR